MSEYFSYTKFFPLFFLALFELNLDSVETALLTVKDCIGYFEECCHAVLNLGM